jgi:GT2 family glycosyltransferase
VENKLISIIVRTKDRPNLLKRALQSIASQTYRPIEVVLVNDGGCDLNINELKTILGDISLNYIRLIKNTGRAHAGNVGIENARGDYIGFLDDDDEFYNDHLATLMTFLSQSDYRVVYSDATYIYRSYDVQSGVFLEFDKGVLYSKDFSFDRFLVKNYIPLMCLIFPKDLLLSNRFDEEMDLYEDWDLLIRLANNIPFYHLKKTTARYVIWSEHLQITEKGKYSGETGKAFSKIFYKHINKFSPETIQFILREHEEEKEELAYHLREKNEQLREKNEQLKQLQNTIAEKDFILSEINNSMGWRFITSYRRIKEKLLPLGTRRRILYNKALRGIEIMRAEGPKAFFFKAKRRFKDLRLKKTRVQATINKNIRPLQFPICQKPLVSIVIPVFNNIVYTFNCLESILENTEDVTYEVIIVNDASTDNTEKILKGIKNITVIHNANNIGFVEASNIGAKKAKGEYIVFMNNDVKVTKGWLKPMLNIFLEKEKVGIVGCKLLYPDGSLQEAGGIVWSDGSAWNYGRNDSPDKCEYNYVREVDYCSAACIMIRKELFEMVDGFDTRYSPAYCEDSDLAFKIREKGYRVLYQPETIIFHYEGMTAGRNIFSGIKKYQETNREKFFIKWKDTLTNDYLPNGKDIFLARERDYRRKKRMLFIDHYVPMPDKDAGSVRMYEYLKIFIDLGFKIVFWPDNLANIEPYTSNLQQRGIEVIYGNRDFREYIQNNGRYFDVAYLTRPHIAARYIDIIRNYCEAKIIYDTQDLCFLREKRRAEIEGNIKLNQEVDRIKERELSLVRLSDATIVVSAYEKGILLSEVPNSKVYLLPHIHPVDNFSFKLFSERKDIMFIGGFGHPPNEDGICWFVKNIFPLITKEIPSVRLYIIGSDPTSKVKALSCDNIIVTGYVKDVSEYFKNTKVFVSPLRYGAGVKGKIIHSMGYGLPVVTTSVGAEGLQLEEGFNILIADDPVKFASKVVDLYNNESLWNKISHNSLNFVKKNFSKNVARDKLKNMLIEIGILGQ